MSRRTSRHGTTATTTTTVFDATTAVDGMVDGTAAVHLDERWSSLRGVHGGYLAALLVRAAEQHAPERAARTISVGFLRAAQPGPASIHIETVRAGRALTVASAGIAQHGRALAVSRITLAAPMTGTAWDTAAAPQLPPFDDCVPIDPPPEIGHFDHAVARLDPADVPFAGGPLARVAGYVRPRQPRPIDAAWLTMLLDWFPPSAFSRHAPPTGGVSVDLTVHLHGTELLLGDDEWLRGELRADVSHGGLALEHGVVAAPDGTILAESFHTRFTG